SSVTREYELDPKHASELEVPLEVAPRATQPVVAAPLSPRPAPERHATGIDFGPWPWVVLGAGGARLVASGAFELARRGAEHDAHTASTQIAYNDAYHREQGRQTAARVLAGVGGVLVVAGGALLVIELTPRTDAKVAAAAACNGAGCTGVLT